MNINNGEIKLNFYDDVLGNMTPDQKRELAALLVWDEAIFDDVVARLATDLSTPNFYPNIHSARLSLREQYPKLAQELIASLLAQVADAKAERVRMDKWAWSLYRLIVDNHESFNVPAIPDWVPQSWAELRKRAAELMNPVEAQEPAG